MRRIINISDYYQDMVNLYNKIDFQYDCIVALKRSGWILGVFLSNQSSKPVFSDTEIKNIPNKFTNILIVDDKICTGKSITKIKNRLKNRNTKTACMYVQDVIKPDFFIKDLGVIYKMFYELKIK